MFKEKTILVTGANRGIGKNLVEEVLKAGAKKVYAGSRDTSNLPNFNDNRVENIQIDLLSDQSLENASDTIKHLDILINNAGIASFSTVLDSEIDLLQKDMETNYLGTLKISRAFIETLKASSEAAIVNTISIIGLSSMAGFGGYSASKAALFSATQSLRTQLKESSVKVFGVFPGPVDTDMIREVEMEKATPSSVAQKIVEGINQDEEDIFPDPMSAEMGQLWKSNPKELEKTFSSF